MSFRNIVILFSIVFVQNSSSIEKELDAKNSSSQICVDLESNIENELEKLDFSVAWCATANRMCSVLLNLLRVAKENDTNNPDEIAYSPIIIQQDLYRLVFISWSIDKKNAFSAGQCNPPHKWISKKIFQNKMNQEFVDNPLGSEAEADLNLGKGNFAIIFGTRENYSKMAIEFYKEITK
jgi:hypothetical protein